MRFAIGVLLSLAIGGAGHMAWAQQPGATAPTSPLSVSPLAADGSSLPQSAPALSQPMPPGSTLAPPSGNPSLPAGSPMATQIPPVPQGPLTPQNPLTAPNPLAPQNPQMPQGNVGAPATSPTGTPAMPAYGQPSGVGVGAGRPSSGMAGPGNLNGARTTNPFAAAQGYVATTPGTIASGPTGAAALPATKPHANYTPAPAISPYMNLFRSDGRNSGVNNYYSLVRPQLQQQAYNQQVQTQVQSLQTTTNIQSQQLNQLNTQPINPYGMQPAQAPSRPPAQFMNLEGYYPGFRGAGR